MVFPVLRIVFIKARQPDNTGKHHLWNWKLPPEPAASPSQGGHPKTHFTPNAAPNAECRAKTDGPCRWSREARSWCPGWPVCAGTAGSDEGETEKEEESKQIETTQRNGLRGEKDEKKAQ